MGFAINGVDLSGVSFGLNGVRIGGLAINGAVIYRAAPPAILPTSIKVSPVSKTLSNGSFTIVATITPSNATDQSVTWTAANAAIAVVDANGKVTTKGKGVTTITASTVNGKTAACTVIVN